MRENATISGKLLVVAFLKHTYYMGINTVFTPLMGMWVCGHVGMWACRRLAFTLFSHDLEGSEDNARYTLNGSNLKRGDT